MKKILLLQQIILIIFLAASLLIGQDSNLKMAKNHFDRGMAAIENAETVQDYEDAVKEFETAKSLAPDWADIYYNLGIVYDKTEKYKEAIENLRNYLRLVPNAEDAEAVETMLTKIEYKNEKALEKKNKYNDLVGIWDRYDSETGEKMDSYTIVYKDNNLTVETWGAFGLITVPVKFEEQKLKFEYLDKKTMYDSEVEFSYTLVDKGLMKGYIRVNVIRKNPGFPVALGQKPPASMEMRKR